MRFAAIDSSLIGGNSPAAAAANLASAVEDFADDAPMRISALQIHADTAARPGLSRVAVRMTAVADVAGLAAFLRAVDGGVRHLAVRELAISQAEPAAPDSKPEMLRIDVLIEGLAQIVPSVVR
ncbi:MAG: hypothetical protein JWM41_4992 [Gemmatimonadetes bacterium]|nr:hypothetical protein [Gemmatimonadota bacterium]